METYKRTEEEKLHGVGEKHKLRGKRPKFESSADLAGVINLLCISLFLFINQLR